MKLENFKIAKEYWNNLKSEYFEDVVFDKGLSSSLRILSKKNIVFSNDTHAKINKILMKNKMQLFTIFMTSLQITVHKITGVDCFLIGTPVYSELTNNEVNKLLPIISNIYEDDNISNYLNKTKKCLQESFSNQGFPIEELYALNQFENEVLSRISVGICMDGINKNDGIEELKSQTNMKILSSIHIDNNSIEALFEYDENAISNNFINQISYSFSNILEQVIDNNTNSIKSIEVVNGTEREQIISRFNDNNMKHPSDRTINELFSDKAKMTPNKIAVIHNEESLTYKELEDKVNSLAIRLYKLGVGKDKIVGILMDRSIDMLVSILAVLKSGGAYMPIDNSYPIDRIRYMLTNSETKILLVDEKDNLRSSEVEDIIEIVEVNSSIYEKADIYCDSVKPSKNDLAYVIYTSGSTGKPKGAMVEHGGMLNHLYAKINELKMDENSVVVQNASHCFDISVWQFLSALVVGGTVSIYGNKLLTDTKLLLDRIEKDNVTILEVVPTYLNALLDEIEISTYKLASLKYLIVTGEALVKQLVKRWFSNYSHVKLVNAYGPTEASDDITHFVMEKEYDEKIVPIGKPIQNLNIYIVNKDMNICPIGVPGELCVSGIGVGRGYINDEEKTNKAFLLDPFIEKEQIRMYKTGDLAKWLPDGNIEFLGRLDHQVKIRGFRIELGEIENELLELDGVKEAIVKDFEDSEIGKYLCAYLVTNLIIDVEDIKNQLRNTLPHYMIPSFIVELDKLPTNKNGKVDRSILKAPTIKYDGKRKYEEPKNEVEMMLVEVWQQVLGIDKFSTTDNFFELGGDSIKAIQAMSKCRVNGYMIDIDILFKYPTIVELGKNIIKDKKEFSQAIIEGEVEISSIQRWFFKMDFENPNYWNQSVLIKNKDRFNFDILKLTLSKLLEHHDALRMVFYNKNDSIIQYNKGNSEDMLELREFGLRDNDINAIDRLNELGTELQSSIKLEEGPLIKVGLFKMNDCDQLLITIHHLVIDGVSWRILLEDFKNMYLSLINNADFKLPSKGTSYMEWTKYLNSIAKKESAMNKLEYWRQIGLIKTAIIPKNPTTTKRIVENMMEEKIILDNEVTNELLHKAHKAYNTKTNDLLLAALVNSFNRKFGVDSLKLMLEGHGRECDNSEFDISRTIGWFTVMYPIYLKNYKMLDDLIKMTKESLRSIPNNGIDYGILKYLNTDITLNEFQEPEIIFDYLGQFDKEINNELFELATNNPGSSRSVKGHNPYSLSFNLITIGGQLEISVQYDRNEYTKATIDDLLSCYEASIIEIIDHCNNKEFSEKTKSDITNMDIEINSLEKYLYDLDIN